MSALTKIFVVLLVVLSLLLAAASVTFLNTIPDYTTQIETLRAQSEAASAQTAAVRTSEGSQRQAAQAQVQQLNARLDAAEASILDLRQQVAQAEAEAAALQTQLAAATGTVSTANQALLAATTQADTLNQQLASLRQENNQTAVESAQTSRALAQAQNELAAAQRIVRRLQTTVADQTGRIGELETVARINGVDPDDIDPRFAPPINGIIVERSTISDRPYATISVGREDDVRPGMEFFIVDRQSGDFLGFVRIEEVDDAEAFGRLEGPNVNNVDSGDRVSTRTARS